VFATVLGLSSTIFAQHPTGKGKDSCKPQIRITKTQRVTNEKTPLSGTIYDPNGAVIPRATVVVENTKTRVTTSVSATEDGQFAFVSLTEGNYSLTIKLAPFKSLTLKDVHLETNTALSIDITLELSGTEVVGLLIAKPSLIDTPPGTFTISGEMITRLPY
jgi:hypothetical protein